MFVFEILERGIYVVRRDLTETDGSHENIIHISPQFKDIINLKSFGEKVSPSQHDTI